MSHLPPNVAYMARSTVPIAIIVTLTVAAANSVLQIPNSCESPSVVTRNSENSSVFVNINTDPKEWINRTWKYPYIFTKKCGLQYKYENPTVSKSMKLVIDVQGNDNDTDIVCSIRAEFAFDDKGVPMKNVSCLKESMEFLWPGPRFYVKFTSLAIDETEKFCAKRKTCESEIHVTLSLEPCNTRSCIHSLDDKHLHTSFVRLEEVNEYSEDCGMIGCLDTNSVGYRIHVPNRAIIDSSKSCSIKFEIRVKEVCIRRFVSFRTSSKDQHTVKLKIDGKFYMEIKSGDIEGWWCLPWNLRGKMLEFSWTFKVFSFRFEEMQLTSRSNPSGFSNCKSKYRTTTRPYSWSSWSSDDWSSWSSDYESSSDGEDVSWLPILFIVIIVGLGVCTACGIMAKRGTRKSSHRHHQAMDYRTQIPLTDVELPQPQPYPMPLSVPLLPTDDTSRAGPSAPETDQASPAASLTPGTVDTTLPPPSYEDVMRGNYIRS